MKKISLIIAAILILSSITLFACVNTPKETTTTTTTTTTTNPPATVRYTVTEEEWNYWTTYPNYTIEQYYDGELILNKYTEDALEFQDGEIILFIDDKQYSLNETDDGYVAHDVTFMEFSHGGLLRGGYIYDEFTYNEELGAYVFDLIAEEGVYCEVRFEDGVPVSILYKEYEDGVEVLVVRSNYLNVGTTVIDIPEYVFEEEDTTRYTVTEEEWNLNLSAGNYSGIIATFSEDDPTSIPYKCTSNAIEFAGMLIVFEGDKMYQLQETEGVWYAFELEGGLGIPTMVPQGLNFSDYEYNADHNMYVPKVKTGAELYYSFGFKDGALSYVMLQTTLDESNPEYYGEFTVFSIYEIGTVEIEIPEYIILE